MNDIEFKFTLAMLGVFVWWVVAEFSGSRALRMTLALVFMGGIVFGMDAFGAAMRRKSRYLQHSFHQVELRHLDELAAKGDVDAVRQTIRRFLDRPLDGPATP